MERMAAVPRRRFFFFFKSRNWDTAPAKDAVRLRQRPLENKETGLFTALNYTAATSDGGVQLISLVGLVDFSTYLISCPVHLPASQPAAALMNVHSVALSDTETIRSFCVPLSTVKWRSWRNFPADLSPEGNICPAPARSPQRGPDDGAVLRFMIGSYFPGGCSVPCSEGKDSRLGTSPH